MKYLNASSIERLTGALRGFLLHQAGLREAAPRIEHLESRQLMSGTSIGVYTSRAEASETDPTNAGRGSFVFKRLTGPTTSALSVQYYVRSTSTAKNGVDFKAISGTVTIPKGARSKLVNIVPIDDKLVEGTESVILVISSTKLTVAHRSASLQIKDNDKAASGWFDSARHFRTAITVDSGSYARANQTFEHAIDFTTTLHSLGHAGSLVDHSLRVIEVNAAGTSVINANVPFQFDKDSSYDSASNASGNLVVLMGGNTAANKTRYFQVYFDTAGTYSAPSFTSLVTTTDDVMDEGFSSIRINTQFADYFYQKAEGGFSSIVDADGNDWINWHATGGSDGEFRGIPNLGPAGFHPGRDNDVTTTIIAQGPLKTTLESVDPDGNKVRWEFYPTYARATIIDFKQNYYFLYEGTPGGSVDGNDTVVRSDGTTTPSNEEWTDADGLGTDTGQEWVYFRDSAVGDDGRYMYFVHDQPDAVRDTYWEMEGNMTVFGFGRYTSFPDHNITDQLLTPGDNLNDSFTIGLANGGSDFNTARGQINGAYRDLSVTFGASSIK